MTIAELERLIESKKRVKAQDAKEKASFDYILADLIGRSISRVYSASNKYPELHEVYPTLFNGEEIQEKKQEQLDELSALRFKQFAQAYSKNKEVAKSE